MTRDARDQRFLLEVKAEYGATLFESREKFEHVLGKAVETDLHGTGEVLDLLRLLVASTGKPVRQVPFQVNLLPTYDTATPQQISESVQSFLSGTAPIPAGQLADAARHPAHVHHGPPPGLGLVPTTAEELDEARTQAPQLPFPLEYPLVRQTFAGASPDQLRVYDIPDTTGRPHPAYVIVVDRGELGQFYDVQGTTWTNPPLLSDPSQEVHIGRRTYGLFYSGEHIRVVAWHEDGAVYWIENTLTNDLSPRAMLAIAEETVPVISPTPAAAPPAAAASPSAFKLPPRTAATVDTAEDIGAGLGFAGLAIVAVLAGFVLIRQREVHALREQVARALSLEIRQGPLLAAAGLVAPGPPVALPLPPPARAGAAGASQPPAAAGPVGASSAPAGAGTAGPPQARPEPGPSVPLRAPAQAGAAAPVTPARAGAAPSSPSDAQAAPGALTAPTVYRAGRHLHWRSLAVGFATVTVLAVGGYAVLGAHVGASGRGGRYPLEVSVFNATSIGGAAHLTADSLRAEHVRIGEVGNINSTLGPGVFVLYPPGGREEARLLARQLPGPRPTVTPIQPQVQSVLGHTNQIVVVLD